MSTLSQHADIPTSPRIRAPDWLTRHPLGRSPCSPTASRGRSGASLTCPAGGGLALLVLGAFGPMAAAASVARATGSSVRGWWAGISAIKVPWRFYLFAMGAPVAVYAAVNAELALLQRDVDISLAPGRLLPYAARRSFSRCWEAGRRKPDGAVSLFNGCRPWVRPCAPP